MDPEQVRRILQQIASGNSVFDTNSTEEASFLGYTPESALSDADAASLRYHLDALARQGDIRILHTSTAGAVTTELTARGREMLRRYSGR